MKKIGKEKKQIYCIYRKIVLLVPASWMFEIPNMSVFKILLKNGISVSIVISSWTSNFDLYGLYNKWNIMWRWTKANNEGSFLYSCTFSITRKFLPSGFYVFIEVSSPQKPGDIAKIESEEFQPTGRSGKCLKFWYNMFGVHIGTLSVLFQNTNGTSGTLWQLQGQQSTSGSDWKYAQVAIRSSQNYKVSLSSYILVKI